MKNFLIIANQLKDIDGSVTNRIQRYLLEKGQHCTVAQQDEEGFLLPEKLPEQMDCAIVIGGDGTLIRAARELVHRETPLIGVNMGTLGYLAEVELLGRDIEKSLDRLIADELYIEERMMLRGSLDETRSHIALNDVVITRAGGLKLIHLDVYVNGALLRTYYADGLILSTPTGTTGYNLSAGGPLIEPTASMIALTPICPHSLSASSIVLSDTSEVVVRIGENRQGEQEKALVVYDGADILSAVSGDTVVVRKAAETARLVKLSRESFMKVLRNKMKGN